MTRPTENEAIDTGSIADGALARRPTLTLDVALYDAYLAESNLGEVQKKELLDALWAIIVGFVDLGFAVEPVVIRADKSGATGEEFASAGPAVAQSPLNSTTDHFEKAAAQIAPPGH